jgi:hypothetical protein
MLPRSVRSLGNCYRAGTGSGKIGICKMARLKHRAGLPSQFPMAVLPSGETGTVPLYSCNLLRSVRMLTSSNFAA